MADAVTINVMRNTPRFYAVHLTNISDGTGESAVIKIDKSTLIGANGLEPTSLDIISVRWCVQGFTCVRILWDHTTDDVGLLLAGTGYDDFGNLPGELAINNPAGLLNDPRSSGATGDILLTTTGGVSGSTYDITLIVRKTN